MNKTWKMQLINWFMDHVWGKFVSRDNLFMKYYFIYLKMISKSCNGYPIKKNMIRHAQTCKQFDKYVKNLQL